MSFLTESEPERGIAHPALPGIARIVATNPSVMTYHGTNSWMIDDETHGVTVLDPGPDQTAHVDDIIAALDGRPLDRILLTHAHSDHYGAVAELRTRTGAPCLGFAPAASDDFACDQPLADGDTVAGFQAVHTPGHASDHLCFAYNVPGTGTVLFSGDHVMSWSSSIVNPPDGDMQAYYRSLERLLARDQDALYLPGHGPVLSNPRELVGSLLSYRQAREASILSRLEAGSFSIQTLAESLYHKTDPWLKKAAERNVLAHLLKLEAEGKALRDDEQWSLAGCEASAS
ncbi:MBL fold metallo-hydrolase [Salinisphaera aquimarina]|uniref:MBL fold metallo-hydrolase n=1 Tax=Salinisphaera aquimarina TaxID=2094031 RepID=A0ABV7EMM8_9GAMM